MLNEGAEHTCSVRQLEHDTRVCCGFSREKHFSDSDFSDNTTCTYQTHTYDLRLSRPAVKITHSRHLSLGFVQ